MEIYETKLYGNFDLDELTPEERAIFEEIKAFAEKDPPWWDLSKLCFQRLEETGVLKKRVKQYRFTHQEPLHRIYSDISLRLCLRLQEKRKQMEKGK